MAHSIRDDDGTSNASGNPHLSQPVDAAIARSPARRAFLKTGLGAAVLPFLGGVAACGGGGGDEAEKILGFNPVDDPFDLASIVVAVIGAVVVVLVVSMFTGSRRSGPNTI